MIILEQKLTYYEKLVLWNRNLQKRLNTYHNLGKTKISLLLIPHSNENIYKVELSYYLIGFLGILSSFTVILSLVYILSIFFRDVRENQILEKGNYQKIAFLYHNSLANELDDAMEELDDNVENLNKVTWGKFLGTNHFFKKLGNLNETSLSSLFSKDDEMKSNMKVYQDTVEKFDKIYNRLENLKPIFYNSTDYLETRESIVQSMPRGRPLGPGIGFISSTYGQREDPVVGGGEFHNGVDFASPNGTPIYATAPGVIGDASFSENSLGNYLKVNHANGFYTMYAHCSELKVKKGDIVKRGELIGLVGSTGKSTGTHVHYEVHIGFDPPYNPQEFINLD